MKQPSMAVALALAFGFVGSALAQGSPAAGRPPPDDQNVDCRSAAATQDGAGWEDVFHRLDKDGDNALSSDEYARCAGAPALASLDADGDGKLDIDEFDAAGPTLRAEAAPSAAGASGSAGMSSSAETARRAGSGGASPSPSATTTGRGPAVAQSGEGRSPGQPPADPDATRGSVASSAGSSGAANAMLGMKAQDLIGREVVNASGDSVGEIDDIVRNEQEDAIYAIVGVGGFLGLGQKNVAIPFEQLRLGADNVILMSQKGAGDLKEMSDYKRGQWKSLSPDQTIESR